MTLPYLIHFAAEVRQIIDNDREVELTVPEIVRPNTPMVSSVRSDQAEAAGSALPLELIAAENCRLDQENGILFAETAGYPFLEITEHEKTWTVKARLEPLLTISADAMKALLTLYPSITDRAVPSLTQLYELIQDKDLRYGIDEEAIKMALETAATQPLRQSGIVIAQGILPIDGHDAFLRFTIDIGPIPGKMLRDGTIDFRERNLFIGVDAGELIATRVAPSPGTPGVDVFGRSIAQQAGKDISFRITGDASYNQENGQIHALQAGVLSVVNDTDITVCAKQTIPGDVDFSVGNIESKDALEIRGNILPGFIVRSGGNVQIDGNVQSATVITGGNALLKGGLLGKKSRLDCQGDADIQFLERAELLNGGSAVLRKGVYYGRVFVDGNISCSPASKVIGGICCSGGNFSGGHVGSFNSTVTTIAAGVDRKRYGRYQRLEQRVADLAERLTAKRARYGKKILEDKHYQQQFEELEQLSNDFDKLNLLPGTPLFSRHDSTDNQLSATITITGTIAAGTILRLGNLTRIIEEDLSGVRFSIDHDARQIVIQPLP
jgi:uncharacterized protein